MSNYQLLKNSDLRPYVSVVVCVRNEAGNITALVDQVSRALQAYRYELIYVNDGSTDQTLAELKALTLSELSIIDLQQNYGQSAALMAGIDAARGEFVVTMDGDLQNDPADIPAMLALAEQGDYDMVAGIRANRQDGALLRKLPSYIANRLVRRVTGVRMQDYGCTLKVIRAEVAKSLGIYGELHRFVGILASLEGARITQLPVRHHPRRVGQSKYGLGRVPKVVSDLILLLFLKKYLRKPMHFFGGAGLLLLLAGLLTGVYYALHHLIGGPASGTACLVMGGMLLLSGVQLFAFGIMAELQMRTYYETQGKKTYKVRRVYRSPQLTA